MGGGLTVVAGSNSIYSGGQEYETVKTIYHENYNPSAIRNDIALVKVAGPIEFNDKVKPIDLWTEGVEAQSDLVLSGWGTTSYPGNTPEMLQWINLKAIDNADCKSRHASTGLNIYDTQICTLTQRGEGACHGDSGGPLVYNGRQVGIVSWGRPCAVGYPDVFTRVSEFTSWVSNTMNSN